MSKPDYKKLLKSFLDSLSQIKDQDLTLILTKLSQLINLENKREQKKILAWFKKELFTRDQIMDLKIYSAQKLSTDIISKATEKILINSPYKSVQLTQFIDPSLGAGLKYRYDDVLFDDTLKQKTNLLKNHLIS